MTEQDVLSGPSPTTAHGVDAEIVALFAEDARSAALIDWAGEHGYDPASILLAGALVRMAPEGSEAFVKWFVATCPRDPALALRWFLWLWGAAEAPVRLRLTEENDRLAAEAVIDMHRRVLAGHEIGNADWRRARRQFAGAMTAGASEAAVDAILSSMWDIGCTPGAIADAAQSWIIRSAEIDALGPAGWTVGELARVTETWDAYGIEHARQNRRHPDESNAAYNARMAEFSRAHPLALSAEDFTRWDGWKAHRERLMQLRSAELRRGLLSLAAG